MGLSTIVAEFSDWEDVPMPTVYLLAGQSVENCCKAIIFLTTGDIKLLRDLGHNLQKQYEIAREISRLPQVDEHLLGDINGWFSSERDYDARFGQVGAKSISNPKQILDLVKTLIDSTADFLEIPKHREAP